MHMDPLASFACPARDRQGRPIPLVSTAYDVSVHGGLAVVTVERTFRNDETHPIEATITFPVPVQAVLTDLTARHDGRTLTGVCQPKAAARETYEAALDRGKAAVLHEEVLKGVHQLSVGPIAAGAEITAACTWVMLLTPLSGDVMKLVIPTTVGAVYGRSPLDPSDDLVTDGPRHMAKVTLATDVGRIMLAGDAVAAGDVVSLDRPIVVHIEAWQATLLDGVSADGRPVRVSARPLDAGSETEVTTVALLVDNSGSMDAAVTVDGLTKTQHQAVIDGLRALPRILAAGDTVHLWEFNYSPHKIGHADAGGIIALTDRLTPPTGGTEIGRALRSAAEDLVDHAVAGRPAARDVVILTDGRSHSIDVQALAQTGCRFHAILIGNGALEARIGQLVAMTGGQIVSSSGGDVASMLETVLKAVRAGGPVERRVAGGQPMHVEMTQGGMRFVADWHAEASKPDQPDPLSRRIGAFAAAQILPALDEAGAAALAVGHGIVCHLTSLVLVDEAATAQEGIPAQRKVALSAPAGAEINGGMLMRSCAPRFAAESAVMSFEEQGDLVGSSFLGSGSLPHLSNAGGAPIMSLKAPSEAWAHDRTPPARRRKPMRNPAPVQSTPADKAVPADMSGTPSVDRDKLRLLAQLIDWDRDPDALSRGDFSALPLADIAKMESLAAHPAILALAATIMVPPAVAAIALVARESSLRSAMRLVRKVFGSVDPAVIHRIIGF